MFTSIAPESARTVTINFEGDDLNVREGLSVAAALLEAGITHFRDTPARASPRAPFCMMGVCFDCLLIIDGVASQQSCMIEVRADMHIELQTGVADTMVNNRPASASAT